MATARIDRRGVNWPPSPQTTQPAVSGLFYESTDMNQLKEAARLALDALSNASWHLPEGKDIDQQCEKAINALRAALALPDAEPVATVVIEYEGSHIHHTAAFVDSSLLDGAKLYTTPQPAIAPEPPELISQYGSPELQSLILAKLAPEPVKLTHAEVDSLVYVCRQNGDDSTYALADAIAAAIHAKQGSKP